MLFTYLYGGNYRCKVGVGAEAQASGAKPVKCTESDQGSTTLKLTKQSIVAIVMLCAVLSVLLIYNSNASASTLRLSTFKVSNLKLFGEQLGRSNDNHINDIYDEHNYVLRPVTYER